MFKDMIFWSEITEQILKFSVIFENIILNTFI